MNPLKTAWLEGRQTLNGWLMLPGAPIAEAMATQPWDSITVDMQHGLLDYKDALGMLIALDGSDCVSLVRIPRLEPGIIGRMLDAGAHGVICPLVDTAEQAEQFVQYMRYPPQGKRSMGPLRPIFRQGPSYLATANEDCVAIAQIETALAVENLEAILNVEGLDAIYVGPSDLSMDMGLPPFPDSEDPLLLSTLEKILKMAKRYKKPAGMHCIGAAYAKKMLDFGFNHVTAGTDFNMIIASSAAVLGALKNTDHPGKAVY